METIIENESVKKSAKKSGKKSGKTNATRELTITDRVRLYFNTKHPDPKKVERIIEMCNKFLESQKQIRIVEIEKQLSKLNAELETLKAA